MKKSFKTIVRAISPFTRKPSEAAKDNETGEQTESHAQNYYWDLSRVDLKQALKGFYKKYNPEKSFIVGDILQKYHGEEILLLQQLCDRYNLDQDDMQEYLSRAVVYQARSPTSEGDNRRRRGSVGSQSEVTRDKDNNSTTSSRMSSPQHRELNVKHFHWELHDVDIAAALELVYSEHNPSKTPNLSVLDSKTDDELQTILRQLCKRHSLTEAQMGNYLKKCRLLGSYSDGGFSNQQSITSERTPSSQPPPPPPRVNSQQRRSSQSYGTLHSASHSAHSDASSNENGYHNDRDSESNSVNNHNNRQSKAVSMAHLRPVLAGGKVFDMGAVLSQIHNRLPDPHEDEEESKAQEQQLQLHTQYNSGRSPRNNTFNSNTNQANNKEAESYQREIDRLTLELQAARTQMAQAGQESRDVLQALQESTRLLHEATNQQRLQQQQHLQEQQEQERQRASVTQRSVGTQATDDSHRVELDKLMNLSAKAHDRAETAEKALKKLQRAHREEQDERSAAEKALELTRTRIKRLQADREDLLQLLSALGPGASRLLDDYLSNLVAKNGPENMSEATQDTLRDLHLPLGDRIDALLHWKRQREDSQTDEPSNTNSSTNPPNFGLSSRSNSNSKSRPGSRDAPSGTSSDHLPLDKEFALLTYGSAHRAHAPPSDSETAAMLNDQYDLARKLVTAKHQQARISEQLAQANLAVQTTRTQKAMMDLAHAGTGISINNNNNNNNNGSTQRPLSSSSAHTSRNPSPAVSRAASSSRPTNNTNQASDEVDPEEALRKAQDWVECFDPRSQRKYFYSASLRKSVWRKPQPLSQSSSTINNNNNNTRHSAGHGATSSTSNSRSATPVLTDDPPSSSSSFALPTANPVNANAARIRNPSPALSMLRSQVQQQQQQMQEDHYHADNASERSTSSGTSLFSQRHQHTNQKQHLRATESTSPIKNRAADWVSAVDPKSQRRYWYNRVTKVSTWRKPVDII